MRSGASAGRLYAELYPTCLFRNPISIFHMRPFRRLSRFAHHSVDAWERPHALRRATRMQLNVPGSALEIATQSHAIVTLATEVARQEESVGALSAMIVILAGNQLCRSSRAYCTARD